MAVPPRVPHTVGPQRALPTKASSRGTLHAVSDLRCVLACFSMLDVSCPWGSVVLARSARRTHELTHISNHIRFACLLSRSSMPDAIKETTRIIDVARQVAQEAQASSSSSPAYILLSVSISPSSSPAYILLSVSISSSLSVKAPMPKSSVVNSRLEPGLVVTATPC
jgi:hypothetical protein